MIWSFIVAMTIAYVFLMTLQVMASWGNSRIDGGAQILVFLSGTIIVLFLLGAISL